MSQPAHPVYTFEANLETVDNLTHLIPDRYQSDADRARTEAANHRTTRSTWLPGLTAGENAALSHGEQITLYGHKAQYVKNTYTTGDNPVLRVV